MAIFDLFSKRQKQLQGEAPDVFVYDKIPEALRVQIVHIWKETLGTTYLGYGDQYQPANVVEAFKSIVNILCREYGVFFLTDYAANSRDTRNYANELVTWFLDEPQYKRVLDGIELSFLAIRSITSEWEYRQISNADKIAENALAELNERFKEHSVGYQFENGNIIKTDSTFAHKEIVKPALELLSDKNYAGPNDEFRTAHEHYRSGKFKEALNCCLNALESTLKVICDTKGWKYGKKDTAKPLLDKCFQNGLIPKYLSGEMSALSALLKGGVPTVRNNLSGHGQGSEQVEVPEYLAGYMMHMTASTLLFLAKAAEA